MFLLPKWMLTHTRPSINDTESCTIIEQTAKIYGAMNELITEYNSFADNVNKIITDFTADTTKNQNEFEIAIRQEFQDFIDAVEIKFGQYQISVENKLAEQQTTLDNAVIYMKDHIVATTTQLINESVARGEIRVTTSYDDVTESLNIVGEGSI